MKIKILSLSVSYFIFVFLLVCPISLLIGQQKINANIPEIIKNQSLKPISYMDSTKQLHLAIVLPLRNQTELSSLLQQLYDPLSPNFHHYLSVDQFTNEFCPTSQDYQSVIVFLNSKGLVVTGTTPNNRIIDASGTVADVEKAFHITMQVYKHPTENRTFFAPNIDPSIDISVPILGIYGLTNYSILRNHIQCSNVSNKSLGANTGTGPDTTYMGYDFRKAYVPDVSLTGSGQSLGLVEFGGFSQSDITFYENSAVPTLPNVPLDTVLLEGFNGQPLGLAYNEDEVCLDIEMAISMAPRLSKVIVYEAPWDSMWTASGWEDLLNRMATDNSAKQLSCSWYLYHGSADSGAENTFEEMDAQGQSFFNASGDQDAYTGLIDFPGDSPNITQVGGTKLMTASDGSYQLDSVWNWDIEYGSFWDGQGSSGGISTYYYRPDWQQANMLNNGGSYLMRNTPDVALTADHCAVYVERQYLTDRGGTSFAAPLWAGFTALINQQLAQYGAASVGFINPAVYYIGNNEPSDFHDVTKGNNTWSESLNKFSAVSGYDLCTGWGTPNGQRLINDICLYNTDACADSNKSLSAKATSNNTQRKLIIDTSNKYHEIFDSDGEIYYRNSTNGGSNWSSPQRLSDGTCKNISSTLTSTGTNIIAVWQDTIGSSHNLVYSRSTNGGSTWSNPSNIVTGLSVSPNPVLSNAFSKIYLAFSNSNGIYYCTSTNNGASWSSSSLLPGTSSTSKNPALTTNSAGWLFLSYDDGSNVYTDYNSGSSWQTWSSPLPDDSREASNTLCSISGDANNLTHYVWQAWDHIYNLGVICYRGVNYQGMNWTPITEFAYYYTPYTPTVMGHLDARGGATVLFPDNNGNIHQVENNGSSWNAGWGVPAQVVATNGNYPNIIEKADSLQAAYLWTGTAGSPYAVHYDFRGSGAMGKNLASANNNLLYHRCVDIYDKSKNAYIDIELSKFNITTQSGQNETADYVEPANSTLPNTLHSSGMLAMLRGNSLNINNDADTLNLQLSYHSQNQNTFKINDTSPIVFNIVASLNGNDIVLGKYNVPDNTVNSIVGMIQLPIPTSILGKNVNLKLAAENLADSSSVGDRWDYNLVNLFIEDSLNNKILAKSNSLQLYASSSNRIPDHFSLSQNYPNPFNPTTIISYDLPTADHVVLKVYDLLGKEVATLYNGNQNAGTYNVLFDASKLASGVYFYQLKAGDYTSIKKMVLLK